MPLIIDKRGKQILVNDFIGQNATLLRKNGYRRIDNIDRSVFKPAAPADFVASIYLVGSKDNWNNFLFTPDIMKLETWAKSLCNTGLTGLVFHNCFSVEDIGRFSVYPVKFSYAEMPAGWNSGLYRFKLYHDFITGWSNCIENIFFTDSTDLEVLQNPMRCAQYRHDKIYIGCEPDTMSSKWMTTFSDNYSCYTDLLTSDPNFAAHTLLNAGLCGGSITAITPFIKRMSEECLKMEGVAHFQDMPIINYLAYTEFKDHIVYGGLVNTVFKAYEQGNGVAWFRHK